MKNTFVKRIKAKIGMDPLERLKKLPRGMHGTLTIDGMQIDYIDPLSTYHQYRSIFEKECYRFENFDGSLTMRNEHKQQNPSSPTYIIDCGANIGLSLLYLHKQHPKAKIVGFEPNTSAFRTLESNISQNISDADAERILIRNSAVWNSDGTQEMNMTESDASSLTATVSKTTQKVNTERLVRYLDRPVDFLKIDIEGAEYQVLKDIEPQLDKVRALFIECHVDNLDGKQFTEILTMLIRHHFSFVLRPDKVPTQPFLPDQQEDSFYYQIALSAKRN